MPARGRPWHGRDDVRGRLRSRPRRVQPSRRAESGELDRRRLPPVAQLEDRHLGPGRRRGGKEARRLHRGRRLPVDQPEVLARVRQRGGSLSAGGRGQRAPAGGRARPALRAGRAALLLRVARARRHRAASVAHGALPSCLQHRHGRVFRRLRRPDRSIASVRSGAAVPIAMPRPLDDNLATAEHPTSTREKALALNFDKSKYGTIAEIGAGQEVARWFFVVGGAAGTVAKTISAYDMAVSDSMYGRAPRYVSRQRLQAMLEYEFSQLLEGLGDTRGPTTTFFAFADTVATRGYKRAEDGRGWIGTRFQRWPGEPPSDVVVHVNLKDRTARLQQETLGIVGVNLIYGVYHLHSDPSALIGSLMDELSRDRVEVDMIKLAGPAFDGVDNRLMSLQLVEQGLTDAAMFTAAGEVVQPSEVLYKRPILVERGSFRPVTKLTLDLLAGARAQFVEEPEVKGQEPVVLMEMTLRSLSEGDTVDHADFLARADLLRALGHDVLISRFEPYYQLAEYLSAYTDCLIGLAVGLPSITEIADERFYGSLSGGALEATGRLFKRSVKMDVYPQLDPATGRVMTIEMLPVRAGWEHLRNYLLETGRLTPIRRYDEGLLSIFTKDVLTRIQSGDAAWETMVPAAVADTIRAKHLFGLKP